MGNASYAPSGSGPFAGAIGWVTFPSTNLAPNTSTIINSILKDGSIVTFTLTNTPITGNISFRGVPASPGRSFGGSGYAGISGNVAFYSGSSTFRNVLNFSNITIKDLNGVTIPNYTVVTCDAESTTNGEGFVFQTNGGVWQSIGNIGSGISPAFNNLGTTVVNAPGNGTTYHTLILATTSPSVVSITVYSGSGVEGIALGFILTKTQVNKVVNNRVYANDQFNFSLSGAVNTSTITTGIANGTQAQNLTTYLAPNSVPLLNISVNETMAPGSTSSLNKNYLTTVQNTNLTPGGTTVPLTGALGGAITLTLGDLILTTITNTAITSSLTLNKLVDKAKAFIGDTLTYTITLNNLGPLTITNTTLVDTLPNGVSFIPGSVTLNGNPIVGSIAPPTGINIGTLPEGISTVTFLALLTSTLPMNGTVANRAYALGGNNLVPATVVTISATSNFATTTLLGIANLVAVKSVNKNYANIGDILTYTIPLQNIGNTTAFNILFIDSIPNGTTLVAGSFKQGATTLTGSPNPPGFTLPNPIGIGTTSTVTFQVTVFTLPNPNPIPNSASQIFSYTIDTSTTPHIVGTGSSSTNTVSTLINRADLSTMIKGVDKNFATLNEILTYLITIPNTGTTTANSVIFRDTIPSSTTLVTNSFKVNGILKPGVSPAPPGTNIGTIPAGEIFTVSFQVQVTTIPSPNIVQNSAATSFTYLVDPTTTAATNGSAGSNRTTTTITRMAIISPTKSVDLPGAFVGDTLTYTINFQNTGTTLANGITFADTLPNGTTFIPDSVILNGVTLTGATLTLPGITLPDLAVGQIATLTFQVVVATTPTPNPTTNQGSVHYSYTDAASGTSGSGSNPTNIVSTYIYPGNNPFKGVDKMYATVGDTLTYTLGFIAALGVQENNVTFSDTIPNDTTFVPDSVFVGGIHIPGATITLPNGLNIGTLPANSLITVSFQVVVNTLPAINPIVNESMVTHTNTISVGTQTELSNTVTTQINLADFSNLSKSVDKPFTTLGDTLTYTVTVTNTGNTTAQNIVFTDNLSGSIIFISDSLVVDGVTLLGTTPYPPTGAFIGTLPAGKTATITFKATVHAVPSPNTIPNEASLSGDYIVDPILGTTINVSHNSNTVVSQVNYADLSSPTKGVDHLFANLGTTLTYTITIVNSGNTTAEHVVFIDTIPNDTTFVDNSVTVNGLPLSYTPPNPLGIVIGTLPTGATSTLTFKVVVTSLPAINPINNSGFISYDFIVDPSIPTAATGGHSTNVASTNIYQADLSHITKFLDRRYGKCGDTITYTISIPNTGNIDATNVLFTDSIPPGTTYIPGSLEVDGLPVVGTPNSVPIGTIPAGNTSVVTFKLQITC